jgi:hypothetical protein
MTDPDPSTKSGIKKFLEKKRIWLKIDFRKYFIKIYKIFQLRG